MPRFEATMWRIANLLAISIAFTSSYGAQPEAASSDNIHVRSIDAAHRTSVPPTVSSSNTPGLALTPPMGWSSWNMFGANINETLIRQTIDAMVSNGLRDAGFVYVNLDDGWQRYTGERKSRALEVDPNKFPSGMKSLADYAHDKGFKFGIYSGPGQTTCANFTGSEGHEEADAALFASWGVDHLKYDSCCSHDTASSNTVKQVHRKMMAALSKTGRKIVYHACHCGWADSPKWAKDEGANQVRVGQDICDEFNYPGNREGYYYDVLDMLDRGASFANYSGPGHWVDYDMLIVGLNNRSSTIPGLGASNIEYRAHFSMWAMVASPLLIGSDVRTLDTDSLATLTNGEIIAINQDKLGLSAAVVRQDKSAATQVYRKNLTDGSVAVAMLNRGAATANITFNLQRDLKLSWRGYKVRDLWKHTDIGSFTGEYRTEVLPHEARVLRLSSTSR